MGWAGGDGQHAGGNALSGDGEGSVGGVRDGGGGDWDEGFMFIVYTHFLKIWIGEGEGETDGKQRTENAEKQYTSNLFPDRNVPRSRYGLHVDLHEE